DELGGAVGEDHVVGVDLAVTPRGRGGGVVGGPPERAARAVRPGGTGRVRARVGGRLDVGAGEGVGLQWLGQPDRLAEAADWVLDAALGVPLGFRGVFVLPERELDQPLVALARPDGGGSVPGLREV